MIKNKLRILIADDYDLVRFGLSSVINSTKDMEVCCEAIDGNDCISKYHTFSPDVSIIDISMPEMNGIEVTKLLLSTDPSAKILILSMHISEAYLDEVLKAGALGYIHKNCHKDELLEAIRKTMLNEFVFSSSISEIIKKRFVNQLGVKKYLKEPVVAELAILELLTAREREILKLVGKGLTSNLIAAQLHISPRTVDTHRFRLMEKLQLKSKIEVVRFVLENKLS